MYCAFYVPENVHITPHLIFMSVSLGGFYYYTHFTDEEAEHREVKSLDHTVSIWRRPIQTLGSVLTIALASWAYHED